MKKFTQFAAALTLILSASIAHASSYAKYDCVMDDLATGSAISGGSNTVEVIGGLTPSGVTSDATVYSNSVDAEPVVTDRLPQVAAPGAISQIYAKNDRGYQTEFTVTGRIGVLTRKQWTSPDTTSVLCKKVD